MEYPKIKNVIVLDDYLLKVTFENNIIKLYDCKPLFKNSIFEKLKDYAFFKLAEKNSNQYAIVWDDDVDLAESEIWINGKELKQSHVS